ncbi:trypsin-like serine peptidase [Microtetraspora malaysiensis]|uniref:trypsin-like serine peptidase n=1 Tax=Microtetraspora malaysiensis TaxID=161358 RepID=UPI003D8F6A4D
MRRALVALGAGLGLLGSTVVSAPAQAADVVTDPLASTVATAQQVAAFWLADGAANLKNATPYAWDTAVRVYVPPPSSPGGTPGYVPPVPGPLSSKGKLPTTSGKVFFVGADGQPHWCSGTAMQSAYLNVVATAGHCVYDTQSIAVTLDKWVFVPGYSEGTTPWGLYVGKQASAHYDFDVYEDFDRDYAFVNVYNGVVSSSSGVLTDSGRLGDSVGGQGLTYNQPTNRSVDVFGYPAGPNPDGTRPYTGQTLEWSYGKTFNAMAPAMKGEDLIGVDSSFTGEGSLGSSWLYQYSNGNRSGYLNGITISVSDTDGDNRYDTSVSPYFDGELYGVYSAAKNLWTGAIA